MKRTKVGLLGESQSLKLRTSPLFSDIMTILLYCIDYRGDPGGMGRFCKMAIFFLWAVARPGFSLLVCEMAFRLKSVSHIRHLGSIILSRDNF